MHYSLHVIHPADVDVQKYIEEKMAPYKLSTWNKQGEWDWWVIGGRWNNYWEIKDALFSDEFPRNVNTVHVGYALALRSDSKFDWMENGPYAYMTLDGELIKRQNYNPDGEGYEENDPNSVFPLNPEYDYWGYLEEVEKQGDIAVTVVDYHC